jgi:xanthine dehydrogenase YagR molybdenum-binding subunit
MADASGRKTIKVPKVINGETTMVEVEVDDSAGPTWGDRTKFSVLDKPIRRVDGPAKVMGAAKFTHDIRLPGMLYARILTSPHAAARVTRIDSARAEALPGVVAVITYGNKTLRYQGDPVGAVAAETPDAAEDGIRALEVEYAIERHVVDPETATQFDAPPIYPGGNVQSRGSKGDSDLVDAKLAQCAAVVKGEYRTPFQHHACLETHGVVVDYRGGDTATVYASTQGTFGVVGDAANALGLDQGKVVCIVDYMGGGFGSKNGLDLPGQIACGLALAAKRPIHLMMTRENEFLAAGNRSGSIQRLQLGAASDGKLVAMKAEQHRLGGLADGSQREQPFLYWVPNVYRTMDSIHANIDGSRAMRAPGNPQASFAMESLMDDLAAALNMDPIDLRKKNVGDPTYHRQIDIGAERIGWTAGRNSRPGQGQTGPIKRGMGMALSQWWGAGGPACRVAVKIAPDGSIEVAVGTQDLGTGTRTYTAAIVAEELGLPVSSVTAYIGDSRLGYASSSGGSTTTASLAPAVKDAAYNARIALFERIAPALGAQPTDLVASDQTITTASGRSVTWKQACAILGSTPVTANGEWKLGLSDGGVHGAQFAAVEVDVETGRVRVLKMVAVQDCGLPLNRLAIENQINGGMIQGLGYALLEGKVTDRETGRMLNTNFEEYKLPGAIEVGECIAIIDDADTRGVIGFSEAASIPMAGAIGNAIFNACGVRVTELPITPDKILAGLQRA